MPICLYPCLRQLLALISSSRSFLIFHLSYSSISLSLSLSLPDRPKLASIDHNQYRSVFVSPATLRTLKLTTPSYEYTLQSCLSAVYFWAVLVDLPD
ncbi:hypothetical protein LOK49_LG14G01710 [Camellia lanceoleosa]|uniref:Uncharacterized protein n=1 Tax=Camellia lanceoleosa TaxID=1840588 RepID=A0ACC0FE16_9ERIC|nr:hypothetical protein LOK49_LG14G01710 [Camellia lanceoleosa]